MAEALRELDLTERVIYLRAIPVAAQVPPHVLHALARCMVERSFPEGHLMMRAGEPVKTLQLLREGGVELVHGELSLGELKPPQSLGFLNIIGRSEGSYDAYTFAPTKTLELETEALLEIMEEHFELMLATLRYAAERLLYEMMELPAQALGFPDVVIPFEVTSKPLTIVEKILYLRTLTVFGTTNLNALAVLARQMPERRVPAGTKMWKTGDPSDMGLLIVEGDVTCETDDGRVFRYGPGTAMGGVEGLADKPRWYTATAKTDLVGLRGDTHQLIDAFEDNFALGMDFVSMLARGLAGILGRKMASGQKVVSRLRNVSNLGAIPVGA